MEFRFLEEGGGTPALVLRGKEQAVDFWAHLVGRRHRGRHRSHWNDSLSHLGRECLSIPP